MIYFYNYFPHCDFFSFGRINALWIKCFLSFSLNPRISKQSSSVGIRRGSFGCILHRCKLYCYWPVEQYSNFEKQSIDSVQGNLLLEIDKNIYIYSAHNELMDLVFYQDYDSLRLFQCFSFPPELNFAFSFLHKVQLQESCFIVKQNFPFWVG